MAIASRLRSTMIELKELQREVARRVYEHRERCMSFIRDDDLHLLAEFPLEELKRGEITEDEIDQEKLARFDEVIKVLEPMLDDLKSDPSTIITKLYPPPPPPEPTPEPARPEPPPPSPQTPALLQAAQAGDQDAGQWAADNGFGLWRGPAQVAQQQPPAPAPATNGGPVMVRYQGHAAAGSFPILTIDGPALVEHDKVYTVTSEMFANLQAQFPKDWFIRL